MRGKESKPHIGIFGRRNIGKSSFINVLAGQDIAIVSDTAGTTTDPVKRSVEIFGIGPAVIIDTAGVDDSGPLGEKRVRKSMQAIGQIDLAIVIIAGNGLSEFESSLVKEFKKFGIPYIFVHNKSDLVPLQDECRENIRLKYQCEVLPFSCHNPEGLDGILGTISRLMPENAYTGTSLLGGLLKPGDIVLLITPIDLEAPEGRMILPQVQTIRDVLDNHCISIVLKETEVEAFLASTGIRPRIAITDSQAFGKMNRIIPEDIPLTGFSVLLASRKGNFEAYLRGTPAIDRLKDGDRLLILESCSHQVNCDDIGRYKIPAWLKQYTGKNLQFDFVSGLDTLPCPVEDYAMVVQCGGCMITRKQLENRLRSAISAGIPVTNYGMAIAYTHGMYERAIAPFVEIIEQ